MRQQVADERSGRHHVFEVVQHQQRLGLAQGSHQAVAHGDLPGLQQPGGAGHGGRHQRRVRDRRQGNEEDAVGEVRADLGGEGESEGGLADAAGAGQGEEANIGTAQEPEGQCQLALPADERREGHRRRGTPPMVRRRCSCHDERQYAPPGHAPVVPRLVPNSGVIDEATINAWADAQLGESAEGIFFDASNVTASVTTRP